MSSLTVDLGAAAPIVRVSSLASLTEAPLTAVMTSPDSRPALAAGPPRRDDACAHSSSEANRIADRDNPISDAGCLVGEFDEREVVLAVHLYQGEVRLLVGADHLSRIEGTVIGGDLHGLRVINHMVVG